MKTEMVYSHDLFLFFGVLNPHGGGIFMVWEKLLPKKVYLPIILPKNLAGALNQGTTFLLYLILQILVQGSFVTA